jgi:transposase-like protein
MEFRVGQIIAKCPGCGGTRFKIPENEHSGPRMSYVCADCGKASEYSKLVTQIGREALRQRKTRLSGERADRVAREQEA